MADDKKLPQDWWQQALAATPYGPGEEGREGVPEGLQPPIPDRHFSPQDPDLIKAMESRGLIGKERRKFLKENPVESYKPEGAGGKPIALQPEYGTTPAKDYHQPGYDLTRNGEIVIPSPARPLEQASNLSNPSDEDRDQLQSAMHPMLSFGIPAGAAQPNLTVGPPAMGGPTPEEISARETKAADEKKLKQYADLAYPALRQSLSESDAQAAAWRDARQRLSNEQIRADNPDQAEQVRLQNVEQGNVSSAKTPEEVQTAQGGGTQDLVTGGNAAANTGTAGGAPAGGGIQTANIPATTISKVNPERRAEIEVGEAEQYAGVGQESAVEQQQAEALAQQKAQSEEDLRIRQLLDDQEREKQRAALNTHLEQLNARNDALRQAKYDPNKFWSELPFGNKIVAAIGLALGALGSTISGQPNPALQILNQQIDRSIDAQKYRLGLEKESLDTSRSLYADKMRLFEDDEKARAATRQEMLAAAIRQIDVMKAQYQSPLIKAMAEQLEGQLLQQFGLAKAQLETFVPAHTVTTGGVMGANGQGAILDMTSDEALQLKDGTWVRVPKEDRERVIGALNTPEQMKAMLPHLLELTRVPLPKRTVTWYKDMQATTSVYTIPELMNIAGKGGKGMYDTLKSSIEPNSLVWLRPGSVVNAAKVLTRAAEARAEQVKKQSFQAVVAPINIPDKAATKDANGIPVYKQRYLYKGPYNPGGLAPTVQAPVSTGGGGGKTPKGEGLGKPIVPGKLYPTGPELEEKKRR